MKTRHFAWLLALVVLAFSACADGGPDNVLSAGETEEGEGISMTFAFGSLDAALDLKKIKTFRIRIYSSTPYSEDENPLFDSLKIHGCFAASGTDVRIQDLKAGADRFVFYEGFADDACDDQVALGIRGGITIEKESALQAEAKNVSCTEDAACQSDVHPDAYCDCDKEVDSTGKKLGYCKGNVESKCAVTPPVYIPLFEVGKFNKFPMPSDTLKADAAQLSCAAYADCTVVHKAATCDKDLGYCTVEGLFPFSPARPRAFHTAQVTGDGSLIFTGGFNRIRPTDNTFYAGAPFFEGYNPYTGLFTVPAVQDNYGGQNVAAHQATLLGPDRLVVTGGISEARLGYELGDEMTLRWRIPHEAQSNCPDGSCVNFSRNILSANLVTGGVVQGMLNSRVMFHRTGHVLKGADEYLLLAGGLTFSDAGQAAPFNQHMLCTAADILADDPNMSCAVSQNSDSFPPRYGHASVCLVGGEEGDACSEFVVFGGVDQGEAEGEVFSATSENFNSLLTFSETTGLSKAQFAELARVEVDTDEPAKVYSFGGVSSVSRKNSSDDGRLIVDFPSPDMQPAQINVNLAEGSMTTAGLDLTALEDAGEVYRLFHTVSVLNGGRIMLAGGVGEDSLPTKSVLFFEEPATHALTYFAKASMREARFGHAATVLEHGLLEGAVLITGGFAIEDTETGTITFADGAEIYIPKN